MNQTIPKLLANKRSCLVELVDMKNWPFKSRNKTLTENFRILYFSSCGQPTVEDEELSGTCNYWLEVRLSSELLKWDSLSNWDNPWNLLQSSQISLKKCSEFIKCFFHCLTLQILAEYIIFEEKNGGRIYGSLRDSNYLE